MTRRHVPPCSGSLMGKPIIPRLGLAVSDPARLEVPTPFLPDRFELETLSEGPASMRILGMDHEEMGQLRKEAFGGIRGFLSRLLSTQPGGYSVFDARGTRELSLVRKRIGWFDIGIWRVAEASGIVVGWVMQTRPPGVWEGTGAARLEDAFRAPVGELEWDVVLVGMAHAEVGECVVMDASGGTVMTTTRKSVNTYSVTVEARVERPLRELGLAATTLIMLDPGVVASLP